MACLPLVRSHFSTLSSSLTKKLLSASCAYVCHGSQTIRHKITVGQMVSVVRQGNTDSSLGRNCHHLCKWYHTGARPKSLANVHQIDLETEESAPVEKKTVNASDVLQNLSPEEEKKLKLIKLEFDVQKEMYGQVPETMTDENWLHVLGLTKSQRLSYYRFLHKKEKMQQKKQEKKEARERQEQQRENTGAAVEKGGKMDKNTIFMMIRESTMAMVGNNRLARAMIFGQPLILDMGYEQFMRPQDCQSLVVQIREACTKNRSFMDPFHIIFTSLDPSGTLVSKMKEQFLHGPPFLCTLTDKSYLNLFPREKLVYLTPHARQELEEVNYNDVYIVGGFVDKAFQKPVSLARAKEQRIRMAKFPLDRHLIWGCGNKSLTIDQVISIMLEQRQTKSWEKAFEHIPRRKLKRDDN